jgi:eukaryotic-like serine/threonine-protein kinase
MRRVSDALSYAHSKGVIHCDIKPANIFMVGRTLPKVVDFGIARVAHGQDIPTLEGVVAGSPHYLAPEQLNGETVDRRCDVYALGVVMYELLTHRKAFDGRSLAEIIDAVKHSQPKSPNELRPEVPAPLSAITMRAMARDPSQRYRSARQMSQALREWLESEAEIAADDGAPASHGPRRMLVATLVLGAVIGAGIGWQLIGSAPDERHRASDPAATSARAAATAPETPAAANPAAANAPDPGEATRTASAAAVESDARATAAAAGVQAQARARAAEREKSARETRERAAHETAAKPAPAVVATGVVQLAVSPWGQIEIDGKSAGGTPPLAQLTLPVGDHVITVRNEDFAPHTVKVRVSADQPVTVRHRFGS